MPPTSVTKFEHPFRSAASVNVDRNDLKRYREFVNQEIYDLLVIGQGTAKANGRDILEARDRTFKIIDPGLKRPMHHEWERAFRIFDLLV